MNILFLAILMIFLHIVDDFYLQGCLANMKQYRWWNRQVDYNKRMYRNDYIMALLAHSFSWSFMIMLPIAYYFFNFFIDARFIILFIFNMAVHLFIDDLKANEHKINLIQDQLIHIVQIIVTIAICCLTIK